MAVLDWLQQLLGGGDPEAQGAAAASTAMMPVMGGAGQAIGGDIGDMLDSMWGGTVKMPGQILAGEREPTVADTTSFALNTLPVRGVLGTIKAYHGSPYDFNAFDASKIGTGEGAQAYGHGLYFAESEPVARNYRDALAQQPTIDGQQVMIYAKDHGASSDALKALAHTQGDVGAAIDFLGSMKGAMPPLDAGIQKDIDWLSANKERLGYNPGKMYEVDINAEPGQFLNWDKPLSEQPSQLRSLFGPGDMSQDVGRVMYKDLARHYGGPEAATEKLQQAGIPGIRYLDQGSRGAGQGTSNYVVFDPSIIQILRKYGLAGLTAGGGLLGAADQQ